ncbi:MAG TPA: hypothetical protein VLW26_05910 [Steroidobacteraceae bacterium]|nr:hypothetical protein [Steroidobacteraceae bacterium]
MSLLPPGELGQRRNVLALAALAALCLIGIFDRGLWTPDEPREADIAWNMSQQSDRLVPHLAGTPFLEKPPLTYWLAGSVIRASSSTAAVFARAPNLLYAALTAVAVIALALAMGAADGVGGVAAALMAALIAQSALLGYRVSIWLAPDAALLAGCAIALFGAYYGYSSPPGGRKLLGYTVMHAGAALGFLAKSAPGWLVPLLALGTLIVWERRWRELLRWELYAGVILQALLIAPWLIALARSPEGPGDLKVLFWHNLVGRFTQVSAPAALDYTLAHRNSPGKYLLELPVGLLPWTVLVVAGLASAWSRARGAAPQSTAWRFAIASSLPFLLVLSFAATARDVYAAPALIGLASLVALWCGRDEEAWSRGDAIALTLTGVLVSLTVLLLSAALVILAIENVPGAPRAVYVLCAAGTLAAAACGVWFGWRAQRARAFAAATLALFTGYAGALCLVALASFPVVDRWQNLAGLATQIRRETAGGDLALLGPDETTLAMMDYGSSHRPVVLSPPPGETSQTVGTWLAAHGLRSRVLVLMPGHAPGELSALLKRWHHPEDDEDGPAGQIVEDGSARIVKQYALPHGRRYALLGPLSR